MTRIMHIALQGCLGARGVRIGLTADTGGHIAYLLSLVAALDRTGRVEQDVVTRQFASPALGLVGQHESEPLGGASRLLRVPGAEPGYLPKEALWRDLPALADALEARLRRDPPDLIHAHYADAGSLALAMRERLGLPFVFTAHSLGRAKAQAMPDLARSATLARRVEAEDRAIAAADLVIASSRDERERQYGLYARPRRIEVIAPGCDLARFEAAQPTASVAEAVDRFLHRPEKPPVLALARPVRRKNLAALVDLFGRSERLRERANLVIYAGCRDDLGAEEAEKREVFAELFALIDRHDLWGSVALPKRHEPGEVPAIMALARRRGGVHATLAHGEPFGLTLVEAAAAGLPVVAPASGGPIDILDQCRHGLLVPPNDARAAEDALLSLLESPALWRASARSGREQAARFTWDGHAARYLDALERAGLVHPSRPHPVASAG
ncbi:MAG: glycosyltransferase [Paracoccaceae bacterium]